MKLTPKDIASFHYCPYMFFNKKKKSIFNDDLNLYEKSIIRAIKLSEESCILKGSEVNPQKIIRQWDKFWWEKAISVGLKLKEAEQYSIKAASVFMEYCKYDISGYMYPSVGKDILCQKEVDSRNTIYSSIDLLKVNLNIKETNSVLIKFGNMDIGHRELFSNLETQIIVNSFFDKQELINFIYIKINEKEKFKITSINIRREELLKINKTVKYLIYGIKEKVETINYWNCKECGQCRNFKF